MNAYLAKPINAQEMIGVIESVAAGARSDAVDALPLSSDPTQSADSSVAAIFDPAAALKRCLGKHDLLAQMIQFFFDDIDKLLPQIRIAAEQGDLTEVGRLGHRLKGTITHLAAESARDAAAHRDASARARAISPTSKLPSRRSNASVAT